MTFVTDALEDIVYLITVKISIEYLLQLALLWTRLVLMDLCEQWFDKPARHNNFLLFLVIIGNLSLLNEEFCGGVVFAGGYKMADLFYFFGFVAFRRTLTGHLVLDSLADGRVVCLELTPG